MRTGITNLLTEANHNVISHLSKVAICTVIFHLQTEAIYMIYALIYKLLSEAINTVISNLQTEAIYVLYIIAHIKLADRGDTYCCIQLANRSYSYILLYPTC
jgi:hypothetical protein